MAESPEYAELKRFVDRLAEAARGGRMADEVERMADLLDALEERRSAAATEAETLRLGADRARLDLERARVDLYLEGYGDGFRRRRALGAP